MTREEKIKELFDTLRAKYIEESGQKDLKPEDYKDESWQAFRLECSRDTDAAGIYTWCMNMLSNHLGNELEQGAGVYDVLFCVVRKGDFDPSDEAKERRERTKKLQKDFNDSLEKGIEKIDEEEGKVE